VPSPRRAQSIPRWLIVTSTALLPEPLQSDQTHDDVHDYHCDHPPPAPLRRAVLHHGSEPLAHTVQSPEPVQATRAVGAVWYVATAT